MPGSSICCRTAGKSRKARIKIQALAAEQEKAARDAAAVETEIQDLTAKSEELLRKISSSGYEELKSQLKPVNELVEHTGQQQGPLETDCGQAYGMERGRDYIQPHSLGYRGL